MTRLWYVLMAKIHMINASLLYEQGRYVDASVQESFARDYERELFRLRMQA